MVVEKLLKPVILMFMLPGLISIAVAAVNVVLLLRENIFLEPKMFYINMGLLVLFMPAALFRSGYVTGNPLFGWLIVPILILALGWAAFLNRFFFGAADLGINFFAEGTDHWKFIFVSVSASNSGSRRGPAGSPQLPGGARPAPTVAPSSPAARVAAATGDRQCVGLRADRHILPLHRARAPQQPPADEHDHRVDRDGDEEGARPFHHGDRQPGRVPDGDHRPPRLFEISFTISLKRRDTFLYKTILGGCGEEDLRRRVRPDGADDAAAQPPPPSCRTP